MAQLDALPTDDDEFGFNGASTHEGHLHQNGIISCFSIERAVMVSHILPTGDQEVVGSTTTESATFFYGD